MKQCSAILLTVISLFNFVGYRCIFNYLQHTGNITLEASLNTNNYNEADLITITVPVSVPYQNNQSTFERVDGEITVDGTLYKYVKRKIVNGNLVLLCLPNHSKMQLESAKNDFFKNANDIANNTQSKKSDHSKDGIVKNLQLEYDAFVYSAATGFTPRSVATYSLYQHPPLPPVTENSLVKPPCLM